MSGSPVTVSGTTAAGNTVYVAATNTDANSATTVASATATDGTFSIDVAVTGGTTVLNIVAVSPDGDTAYERRTILFDFVPGTLLLDVADPDGDDNGPGNYAYPTSPNFHDGAFDIQAFQVFDAGSDVIFRVRTRDLSETFGSALGAQLVDIYVHDPAGGVDLDGGGQRVAQLPDRAGVRLEPADPGAGLRPALRGRRRRHARHGRRSRATPSPGSSRSACPSRRSASPAPAGGSRWC